MMAMSRKRGTERGSQVDVILGEVPQETVGIQIVSKLATKGFCVIAPGFEDGTVEKAVEEIREFDNLQRWYQVNRTIQEGLLGPEGSHTVADLESPELDDEVRSDGETLMKLDYTITHIGFRIEPYIDRLGIDVSHRSLAVVHQAGEVDENSAPLTEKQVMKWLAQFLRHRIMVIVFLGPSSGTLELKPYDVVDTEVHEVQTRPGTIVVLRPDLMNHKHFSPGKSYAMSSFFLTGTVQKRTAAEAWNMIPAARELDDWTLSRLRELKEKSQEDSIWDPDIPRDWQHAMNHMYHKGQMISVRGAAVKFPSAEDCDTFFQVGSAAPDYAIEVPLQRWDHSKLYDGDLESWKQYKCYCKHGAFMEGTDMFDCKMFSMSPNEAKTIDPHQRLILEVGYQALFHMGMRKNTLVNASCGCYVGCANMEWNMVPKTMDGGAFGATGGALSIASGRFSFTLGLKGASMTLDTEACSGATAMYLASESVQTKGTATPHAFGIALAANLMLDPFWWPTHCAAGWLSAEGRSMTFNASAAGYIRADGVGAVCVKTLQEMVDGEDANMMDDDGMLGAIAGAHMNNNGKGASLSAPHGPAEQETVAEAIRNANVSPFDVDGVETFGAGAFLADAIEAGSMIRAHRNEDQRDPLSLMALKSSIGNQVETSAIASLLRTLYAAQWGYMIANLHLEQANPHMDAFDQPCAFLTEILAYKMQSSFVGVMSRGFGGANCYLLTWGQINTRKVPQPQPSSQRDAIMFWPGGGGNLDSEAIPRESYTVVGSWSEWQDPEPLEEEGLNDWSFTVTLGENRWEMFSIWLDGDATKVLHPDQPKASKDFSVLGPVKDPQGCYWMIDGRSEYVRTHDESSMDALKDADGGLGIFQVHGPDYGMPGDQYRVHLRIAGKWQTVTWEKITSEPLAVLPPSCFGSYYVTGTFNDWGFLPMEKDASKPDTWIVDAQMGPGSEFQIVRNKDWYQVFYPAEPWATGSAVSKVEVLGPDELGEGMNWYIGNSAETFRIEFSRKFEEGEDKRTISWSSVRAELKAE